MSGTPAAIDSTMTPDHVSSRGGVGYESTDRAVTRLRFGPSAFDFRFFHSKSSGGTDGYSSCLKND
jgi:hypothetical protein